MIKYVVMNFYTPTDKTNYRGYEIHIYSQKSSNKDSMMKYYRKVKQQKTYKDNPHFKWYVLPEQRAHELWWDLHNWKKEEERKDLERRFPCRPMGKTRHDEIAEMMSAR